MRNFLVLFLFSIVIANSSSVLADKPLHPIRQGDLKIPSFSDYEVDVNFFTKADALDLNSHPSAKNFRTRLSKGFLEDADFAGHYKIVTHGCGSSCQVNWIIDLKTGKVVDRITSSFGISYKLNSSLIIRGCDIKEYSGGPDVSDDLISYCYSMQGGITLFKVENDKLVKIQEIPAEELFQ